MTTTTTPALAGRIVTRRGRTALVAYVFAVTMAGTTLPGPLYPIFQRTLGFGSGTTTVVYAVYAAGVLAALLLFGRVSDLLGRRPVMAAALTFSVFAGVLFLAADALAVLLVARVLSGLSAGLITVAATAAMIDVASPARRSRAALAAAAVSMLGLGLGPLLSGTLATVAPAPLVVPFVAQLALLVPAGAVVARWPGPATGRTGGLREALRPQRLRVHPSARAVFVPSAVAAVAAFSVFGLLTAVEPGVLATVLHESGHLLAGAVGFAMFAASAVGQLVTAGWPFRRSLSAGCGTLVVGLALVLAGLVVPSLAALLVGTVIIGLGHGSSFRAGMTAVTRSSPDDGRGEAVGAFMTVAYVSISVPVLAVGLLTTAVSLVVAAAALVIAAAVAALAAAVLVRRRSADV